MTNNTGEATPMPDGGRCGFAAQAGMAHTSGAARGAGMAQTAGMAHTSGAARGAGIAQAAGMRVIDASCLQPAYLKRDEAIEDLQCGGLRLIQGRNAFRFGIDSVLLANFAKAKRGSTVVELCAGGGVISTLMSAKTEAERFIGVEIQDGLVDMANRSAMMNGLSGRLTFMRADLRLCAELFEAGFADAVVVNPPYVKRESGIKNQERGISVARHEICCTLGDVMAAAAYLLRGNGELYMVHRPNRLADICCSARENGIEPKYIQMVHSKSDEPPTLVLVNGKKSTRANLEVMRPLYV